MVTHDITTVNIFSRSLIICPIWIFAGRKQPLCFVELPPFAKLPFQKKKPRPIL